MYRKDHILSVNERNGWNKRVNRICWDENKRNSHAKKENVKNGLLKKYTVKDK